MTWLSPDARLLLAAKVLRTVGYGLLTVLFGLHLHASGFSPAAVGLAMTLTMAGAALITNQLASRADRFGRRRVLRIYSLLLIVSALVFAWARSPVLIMLAALTGTLSPHSGEVGPFEALEASMLPSTVSTGRRNQVFAWYYGLGALAVALGALCAGLADTLEVNFALSEGDAYRWLISLYALLGALSLLALSGLSEKTEYHSPPSVRTLFGLKRSRPVVIRLAALFGLDALAGGFVVHGLLAYWLALRFDVSAGELGLVFFGLNLLNGLSYYLSAPVANHLGLLNTMVFTHLPSNLLLIFLPMAPTFSLAVAVLVGMHIFGNMDVPTRASYVSAIVEPEERTAAMALTMSVRPMAQSVSPVFSGLALQFAATGVPFVLAGGLKVLYDILLYRGFHQLKPTEERVNGEAIWKG